jgi:uncharacterized coiled-coil DUF342 family protein
MELFAMDIFDDKKMDELEAKIDGILTSFQGVKDENSKLQEKLQTLENENRQLKEKMTTVNGERDKVLGKVKKILEKIEKVEV